MISPNDPTFPIGTRYVTRGRAPRECEVVDVLKTYNSAGDLVKVRYVSRHMLMGREIIDHDVPGTTIKMGIAQ